MNIPDPEFILILQIWKSIDIIFGRGDIMTNEESNKNSSKELSKEIVLEDVIGTAIQIPGVKVNRDKFLAEQFASSDISIQEVLDLGPVEAGISREELAKISNKLVIVRTSQSSIASFVAGIPGGLAMAATIPADIMQFFGMALRLAQEISYLYGAQDLWVKGKLDDERVKSQLIMYCGVMFGVSGAVSGLRVLSTQLAKTALKKIPQKALTKTFWYPIIKQIGKAVGVKVTKSTVAQGVSKAIPIVGGVISGGLNFASMMPMANRLSTALDKATFDYSDDEFDEDIATVEQMASGEYVEAETESDKKDVFINKFTSGFKTVGDKASGIFGKREKKTDKAEATPPTDNPIEKIKEYKELLDLGIITQDEFDAKKKELLQL